MLDAYREKWREAPRGSDADGRIFSSELLKLSDSALLAEWEAMAARRYTGEIAWVGELYRDSFRGRQILELGSGLGFDGLRFAAWGAEWIFADIVPDNLRLIERIATLKNLRSQVRFHLIPDELTFEGIPAGLDGIWVFGSIHHVPFSVARTEALNALSLLRVGGRWLELVYPRDRWIREGSLPFSEWGKLTDGDRTPWVEWHNAEKVRARLAPASLHTILNFPFCSANYEWIDFRFDGFDERAENASFDLLELPLNFAKGAGRSSFGNVINCPKGLFAEALRISLHQSNSVAIVLEADVIDGAVGFFLVDELGHTIPAGEAILSASPNTQLVTLRGAKATALLVRNLHAQKRGRFSFVTLRQT